MTDTEINHLWDEYYPKVFGYFYRRLTNRQDIEDLTSVSLTAFLTKIDNPSLQIENKNAYLWRICHNQLAMLINTKSKTPAFVPYDESWIPQDTQLETNYSAEFKTRMQSLQACINKHLTPEESQLINLAYIEQQTSQQIATYLNSTAVAIRKRLSRSINKIKKQCSNIWLHYT